MYRIIDTILSVLAIVCTVACSGNSRSYADMIIEGRVFTAEDDTSFAYAVAIMDGKIISLDDEALSERGENTQVIKTDGLVLPGFVDCGSHGAAGIRLGQLVKSYGRDTIADGTNPFAREKASDSLKRAIILDFQKMLVSNGITTYRDACTNFRHFDLVNSYEQLDNEGKIFIHTFGTYKIQPYTVSETDSVSSLSTAFKGGNFELNSIRIYLDSRSLLPENEEDILEFVEDTLRRPNFTADDIIPSRKVSKIIASANEGNLSADAHAYGPNSIKTYSEYISLKSSDKIRNSLTHIQYVDQNSIYAMKNANVIAVVNPFFFSLDSAKMDSTQKALYNIHPEWVYPLKELIDKNIKVAVGIDFPTSESLNFIDAIYHMVARKHPGMPDSTALCADQGIDVTQAIRCATVEGSYLLGQELKRGTVSAGKEADLVILDKDITACPEEDIPEADVEYTIISGKIAYRKSDTVR